MLGGVIDGQWGSWRRLWWCNEVVEMKMWCDIAGAFSFQIEMVPHLIHKTQDGENYSPLLGEWCSRIMILPTLEYWIFPLQVMVLLIMHPIYWKQPKLSFSKALPTVLHFISISSPLLDSTNMGRTNHQPGCLSFSLSMVRLLLSHTLEWCPLLWRSPSVVHLPLFLTF